MRSSPVAFARGKAAFAKHGSRAFTLTEILIVITMIAALAVLISPAFQSAMRATKKAKCVSNLKQLSGGIGLYAADNNGILPPAQGQYVDPNTSNISSLTWDAILQDGRVPDSGQGV